MYEIYSRMTIWEIIIPCSASYMDVVNPLPGS